jgi:hypothetical protein
MSNSLADTLVFRSTTDRCSSLQKVESSKPSKTAWSLRLSESKVPKTVLFRSSQQPLSTARQSSIIASLLSDDGSGAKRVRMPHWQLVADSRTNQIDLQSTFSEETKAHLPVIAQFVWDVIGATALPKVDMPIPCSDMSALDLIAAIRILRRLGYYGATVPLEKTLVQGLEGSLNNENVLYLTEMSYCEGLPYLWRFLRANNAYNRLAKLNTPDAVLLLEQWDEQGAPTRQIPRSTAIDQSQFFWIDDSVTHAENDALGQWNHGREKTVCSAGGLCAKDGDACSLCKQTLAEVLVWNLMYGQGALSYSLKTQAEIDKFIDTYSARSKRRLVLRFNDDTNLIDSCAKLVDRQTFAHNITVTIGVGKPADVQFVQIEEDGSNSVNWPLKSLYEWFCIMLWQHSTLVIDISETSSTTEQFYTTVSSNAPPIMSSIDQSEWIIVPLTRDVVAKHLTAKKTVWFEQFANMVASLGLRVVESVNVPDTCLYW